MGLSGSIYVIVLNWQNAAITIECLGSLLALPETNFQVVIVDNASADDSVLKIKEWLKAQSRSVTTFQEADLAAIKTKASTEAVLIRTERNYGYAGGNNRGLRYVLQVGDPEDLVWIVNNDTVFDRQALTELVSAARQRPEISLFGSTIVDYHARDRIQTQGGDRFYPGLALSHHIGVGRRLSQLLPQAQVERQLGYIIGAAVLIRLAAVRRIGLMEEGYFLYFEEIDWATRAKRAGLRLGYVPTSLVYHQEGATTGSSVFAARKSAISDYYGIKNRLVMTKKLFPWALPTVYLTLIITLFRRLITGQFDRVLMVAAIMLGVDRPPRSAG